MSLVNISGKLVVGTLILLVVATAGFVIMQGGDGKVLGSASGKTVSTKSQVQIAVLKNIDPKTKKVNQSMIQLGVEPILALVGELEARGSSVDMTESESNGISTLRIKIDGTVISPIVSECKICEPIIYDYEPIIFEY